MKESKNTGFEYTHKEKGKDAKGLQVGCKPNLNGGNEGEGCLEHKLKRVLNNLL